MSQATYSETVTNRCTRSKNNVSNILPHVCPLKSATNLGYSAMHKLYKLIFAYGSVHFIFRTRNLLKESGWTDYQGCRDYQVESNISLAGQIIRG